MGGIRFERMAPGL